MFTNVFLLNIVYFSVCLTSNKLYWIDDQLADVSTRFYTSASWRQRVGVSELASASWSVGELTVIQNTNAHVTVQRQERIIIHINVLNTLLR